MKRKVFPLLLLSVVFLASCSLTRTVALDTTAVLIKKGSKDFDYEYSWDVFKETALANLKTVEGFLFNDKENRELLATVVKGYAGLGFGVHETLFLDDKLKEKENSQSKELAIDSYSRAIRYGINYLKTRDIAYSFLTDNVLRPKTISEKLNSELSTDDIDAVFYMAQAWAGLINLQRDDLNLVAQMPIVKGLFDWACEKNPMIQYGACAMFYGLYELSRPKMLGGNPQKGKDILKKYASDNPYNLLATVTYLEYVIVNSGQEGEYKKYKKKLLRKFSLFKKLSNFSKVVESNPFLKYPHLNLVNAIAMKRFFFITKNENELF